MHYSVILKGLSPTQGEAWAADMRRNGHEASLVTGTPVAPAPVPGAQPSAYPPHTAPTTQPPPPVVDGITWQAAGNGNGWKGYDASLSDVTWLWNADGRPMADGTPGAWVVKARVMGHWLSVAARPELVRQFGSNGRSNGFPRGRRRA